MSAKGNDKTSILLFELNDISLGSHIPVGQILHEELSACNDPPDDIYLIRTELEPWVVWVLKEGAHLFRDVLQPGPYYLDENSSKS